MTRYWTDYLPDELEADLQLWGLKAIHARLLLKHWHEHDGALVWQKLPSSARMRSILEHQLGDMSTTITHRHDSADGTVKLLISLSDARATEAVLMPSHRADRAAACISSQVGCAMGCDFCATAKPGLTRNLTAGEIVEQFVHLKREATKLNRRITSLVFMGMGEPLHNFDPVVRAIRIIGDPMVGGLGWRQITVSTVGIVPMMDRLAELDLNVHLALSLHGADDETRSRIVPMNRKYNVGQVMSALRRFQHRTGRITTIEWCLIKDVNDSDEQAMKLSDLMQGFRAHVNVIPHNPIGAGLRGTVYQAPAEQRIERFISILRDRDVIAHRRVVRGDSIAAACGQLAGTSPLPVLGV